MLSTYIFLLSLQPEKVILVKFYYSITVVKE